LNYTRLIQDLKQTTTFREPRILKRYQVHRILYLGH